jgi:hypothetical protein
VTKRKAVIKARTEREFDRWRERKTLNAFAYPGTPATRRTPRNGVCTEAGKLMRKNTPLKPSAYPGTSATPTPCQNDACNEAEVVWK